jgi:hypothetical protein
MTNQESKSEEIIQVIHGVVESLYQQIKLLVDAKAKPSTLRNYISGIEIINQCWFDESIRSESPSRFIDSPTIGAAAGAYRSMGLSGSFSQNANIDNEIFAALESTTKMLEERNHRIAYLEKLVADAGIADQQT